MAGAAAAAAAAAAVEIQHIARFALRGLQSILGSRFRWLCRRQKPKEPNWVAQQGLPLWPPTLRKVAGYTAAAMEFQHIARVPFRVHGLCGHAGGRRKRSRTK